MPDLDPSVLTAHQLLNTYYFRIRETAYVCGPYSTVRLAAESGLAFCEKHVPAARNRIVVGQYVLTANLTSDHRFEKYAKDVLAETSPTQLTS